MYSKNLEQHIDRGNHVYRRIQPVIDDIKQKWISRVREVKDSYAISMEDNEEEGATNTFTEGWAIKTYGQSKRPTPEQEAYIKHIFDLGNITGCKEKPEAIKLKLRRARDENGDLNFPMELWLKKTLIASQFSMLASNKSTSTMSTVLDKSTESEIQDTTQPSEVDQRDEIVTSVIDQLSVHHPIVYEQYNLCEVLDENDLKTFNRVMIQAICDYFGLTRRTWSTLKKFVECCPCRENAMIE